MQKELIPKKKSLS